MKTMTVKITFKKPLLGSLPSDETAFQDFIAVKAPVPTEDELEAIKNAPIMATDTECVAESPRGVTIFPKTEDGKPFLYDYQLKGFLKAACSALRRIPAAEDAGNKATLKIKAFKKIIDTLIFIEQREIALDFDGEIELKSRSLRAQTAQGERISIATSEMLPAGTTATFTIQCLDGSLMDAVREWLDYGRFNGIGCWRNSGMGQFTWEEIA